MRHVREDTPVIVVERGGGNLGAFLLGVLIGGGIALLFAPQSGEETRLALKERGRRLREAAGATAEALQGKLEEGYERAKARVEEGFETARRTIEEKKADAKDAIEAGKAAAHSAREELERRLAESRAGRSKTSATTDAEV
jgi:gas vesicle protein